MNTLSNSATSGGIRLASQKFLVDELGQSARKRSRSWVVQAAGSRIVQFLMRRDCGCIHPSASFWPLGK
jgi:hypothetical protein